MMFDKMTRSLPLRLPVLVALVVGCKSSEPAPPKFDPVTKDEAESFGKRFATLLDTCDVSSVAPLWNAEVTSRRAVKDAKASDAVKDGMVMVFTAERLWEGQCQTLTAEGDNKNTYLGVRQEAGDWRPYIRMVGSNGLNYIELELGRFPGGIQAVDATYYLTGEPLSRTLARLMGSAQSALDDGDLHDGSSMERISMLQRQGDVEGALALIKELPPALRGDKSIMLLEIGLDPGNDDARYLAAIERFEKAYPNDPALDLVSIDGFLIRKQFDRLHSAIDRLDRRVNDPYLEVMRAFAYISDGKTDKARVHVDRAIEREPSLQDAWDTKSTVCLAMKDYACAVAALQVLADKFELAITDEVIGTLDNGAELLASEEYKAWRRKTE